MNNYEFAKRLLKYESKEDIVNTLSEILCLLFHHWPGDSDFIQGSNEEKDFIVWLCDLEKYRNNELL